MFDPNHLLYVVQTSYSTPPQHLFPSAKSGAGGGIVAPALATMVIGLVVLKAVFRLVWGALQAFFMLLFLGIVGGLGYFSFEGFKSVSGMLAYISHLF